MFYKSTKSFFNKTRYLIYVQTNFIQLILINEKKNSPYAALFVGPQSEIHLHPKPQDPTGGQGQWIPPLIQPAIWCNIWTMTGSIIENLLSFFRIKNRMAKFFLMFIIFIDFYFQNIWYLCIEKKLRMAVTLL